MNADHALEKLKQGNKRFVTATEYGEPLISNIRRAELALEQKPFAIILGCSDSRVPAELVFSQGMGDLFVIRVAGNVVAPSQIGSVEFACQQFGTELVVVLGHQNCGAISATVDSLLGDPDAISPNIAAIVDRVTPAVHAIVAGHPIEEREELLHKAMRANVEQSVQGLQMRSRIIRGLIGQNRLKVIGAEYSIESGVVKFYE
ncbi:MAG: carbonic anhydrase [Arenicella sp.]|jgi:carbonic anhydrase